MDELSFSIYGVLERAAPQEFRIDTVMEGLSVPSAAVPEGALVHVEGVVERAGTGVLVGITVSAPYQGNCARCLEEVEDELVAQTRELFIIGPTTEDSYGFEGSILSLEEVVRDLVVTHLPSLVLCDISCKGLCPICGQDRNELACNHEAPIDPRWAALSVLEQEREGE